MFRNIAIDKLHLIVTFIKYFWLEKILINMTSE